MAEKIATREAYGKALAELGEKYDFVVLDADLSAATKTGVFKKKYPERFFNCGIAEGNMVSVAAGLAAAGKIPFVSSFAKRASRFGANHAPPMIPWTEVVLNPPAESSSRNAFAVWRWEDPSPLAIFFSGLQ